MSKQQHPKIFAKYFDKNISLLKQSALWWFQSNDKKQIIYNSFWAIYLYFIYFPTECFYLYYVRNDLNEFVRSLRDIGNHIALLYKAANFYFMHKAILQVIETLKSYECDYDDCENFKPAVIVEEHRKEALKWSNIFWYFVNGICASMFITGLYTYCFNSDNQYVVIINNATTVGSNQMVAIYRQSLPVKVVSPFGDKTKIQFLVTFFYVIIALTFYGWMIIGIDSFLITLMNCLTANLMIIKGAIKTIRPRCLKKYNLPNAESLLDDPIEVQEQMHREIIKCIKHLQLVFKMAEKLEEIYNVQTFVQILVSLGEMCFSLYLLSERLDANTGNEITYLISTSFQLLLYCWFGHKITEAVSTSTKVHSG